MKSSAIYFIPFGFNNMEEKNSRNLNFGPDDAIMQMSNSCANSISRLYDCQHRILTETIKVLTKDAFLTEKTLPSPCTAFSQSLSANSLRLDYVTRNALVARNNEVSGLGKGKLRFRLA